MILIIDNYDSFVYNLVQRIGALWYETQVVRNDAISVEEIEQLNPSHIIISPGPGNPDQAGISLAVIKHFHDIPLLWVCLWHQCIVQAFGGNIIADIPMHGKSSMIHHDGNGVYATLPQQFVAWRYHSLIAEKESLPDCLTLSAWDDDGVIMGVRHKQYPIEWVQFHPESIMTPEGTTLLQNFILQK